MDFFEQNDAKVNKRMTKVLMWMTLVFPALFVLTAAGVFWIKYDALTKRSRSPKTASAQARAADKSTKWRSKWRS